MRTELRNCKKSISGNVKRQFMPINMLMSERNLTLLAQRIIYIPRTLYKRVPYRAGTAASEASSGVMHLA